MLGINGNYPQTRVLEDNLDDRTKFYITQQCALAYFEKWRNRRYGAARLMLCSLLNSRRMIAGIKERNIARCVALVWQEQERKLCYVSCFSFLKGKEVRGSSLM